MSKEIRLEKRAAGPEFEQNNELVVWAHDDGSLRTTDEDGSVTAVGSGGSVPGSFQCADFDLVEETTAGTYTASLPLPAGTMVFDVILYALAYAWAADTAVLTVGDTLNGANSWYQFNVKSFSRDYDPASVDLQQNYTCVGRDGNTYESTALCFSNANQLPSGGIVYQADDTLTVSLVTTIVSPPVVGTGHLRIKVIYFTPPTPAVVAFS